MPRASGASGSAIRNVAPWPSAVRSDATPPWAATSARTIARPSPLPPVARVLAWLAYHVDRRHRLVAADNLRHAFPDLDEVAVDRLVADVASGSLL